MMVRVRLVIEEAAGAEIVIERKIPPAKLDDYEELVGQRLDVTLSSGPGARLGTESVAGALKSIQLVEGRTA